MRGTTSLSTLLIAVLSPSLAYGAPPFAFVTTNNPFQYQLDARFSSDGTALSWSTISATSGTIANSGVYYPATDTRRQLVSGAFQASLPNLSSDGSIIEGWFVMNQVPPVPPPKFFREVDGTRTIVDSIGDLSSDGLISAGGSFVTDYSSGAAVRTPLSDLGADPIGQHFTTATAISGDGTAIAGFTSSPDGMQAFLRANGSMIGLGDLPGGAFESAALDISLDGSTIIGTSLAAGGREAFVWRQDLGGMVGLGDLPGGLYGSSARDLSFDGRTIVGEAEGANGREAVVWHDGVMQSLGRGSAAAVSADGSAVVGNHGDSSDAFYWSEATGMLSVQALFEAAMRTAGLDPRHYLVLKALDVSPDGRTIAGSYIDTFPSQVGIFYVVVPEPGIGLLVGLGLIGLARRRRSDQA